MKKFLLLALIFNFQFSIFNSLRAQTVLTSGRDYAFNVKEKKAWFISNSTYDITDAIIPDSVEFNGINCAVVGIDNSAFEGSQTLKSIKIGNCVQTIGQWAFSNCVSLKSVILGNGLETIEHAAFNGCESLSHVNLGNSLQTIGPGAFTRCYSLHTIIIPNSIQRIGGEIFSECPADLTLSIPYGSRSLFSVTRIDDAYLIERNPVEQDVNNDGHINSGDVVTIYNYIIDPDATGIHPFRADTNLDGDVNSGDVVDIYNAIISDKPVKPIDPVVPPTPPADTLPYPFSVSNAKTVSFSKGNLQYVGGKWQFASKQYEYFGTDQSSDHKDMFPFNGYTCPEGWYCLTNDEWTYLLSQRTVSNTLSDGALYTLATLGDTYKGMIVFPDTYTHPDGTGFTAGTYNTFSNYTATVSLEGWALMEKAGAMFLPCAGYKSRGETWKGVGTQGCYMTTTATGGNYYDPWFDPNFVSLTETSYQSTWSSVRLVK